MFMILPHLSLTKVLIKFSTLSYFGPIHNYASVYSVNIIQFLLIFCLYIALSNMWCTVDSVLNCTDVIIIQ